MSRLCILADAGDYLGDILDQAFSVFKATKRPLQIHFNGVIILLDRGCSRDNLREQYHRELTAREQACKAEKGGIY